MPRDRESSSPFGFGCPHCGGVMQSHAAASLIFICHLRHSFTAAELDKAQMEKVDQTLEVAARMINERALLCQIMGGVAHDAGDDDFAFRLSQARREIELKSEAVRKVREEGWSGLGLS